MTVAALDRRDAVDAFAVGVMLFLTFCWGLNGVASKISNQGFNPVLVHFARSAIAAALVYGWCLYRKIPVFNRDGTFWPGLATGITFGVEFLLIFIGFDYTSAGRGSLLLNAMPFWVLLGAHFLLGEKLTPQKIIGVLLAFAGVYLIFSDRLTSPGPDAWIGDVMMLIGRLLWAATSLIIKRTALNEASPEKILLYQLAISALVALPVLPFAGALLRNPDAISIGSVLFQAVFIVAVTYLIWFWLMRRYPASGLSTFAFLTPAFSVLMGALILKEPLSWKIGAALVLIAIGLAVVNRPAKLRPAA